MNGDAFLLKERLGVADGLMDSVSGLVVGIMNDLRGVIALQLEYQLQVIT